MVAISKWLTFRFDQIEHMGNRRIEERVRPQGTTDASHHDGGLQSMAGDVANNDPELSRRQRENVIPVTAHVVCLGGGVTGSEGNSGTARELRRQQTAFDQFGSHAFKRRLLNLEGARYPIGHYLQE